MKTWHLGLAALVAAACTGSTRETGGDRSDETGSGPKPTDFRCEVVELLDGVFEESLAGIFDFDDDGEPTFDSDATSVSLSKDASGLDLSLGHMGFSESAKDKFQKLDDDTAFIAWKVTSIDSGEVLTVRIFETSQIGLLSRIPSPDEVDECVEGGGTKTECKAPSTVAKLDCRDGAALPDFPAFEL